MNVTTHTAPAAGALPARFRVTGGEGYEHTDRFRTIWS